MARQEGLIKLRGKIGDLSFYKDKNNGYQARMKGGPTKEQINSDPRFQRTRENGQEFGRAIQTAKQLRDMIREHLAQVGDPQFSNRLTARMRAIIQADTINARGERAVLLDNLPMIKGMECNLGSQLGNVFFVDVAPAYDRQTGEGTLAMPDFLAKTKVKGLEGATHVQVLLVALEFDPANPEAKAIDVVRSSYIDIGKSDNTNAETLTVEVQPQANSAVITLMGLSYYQLVNGGYYPLANGMYNALTFVEVYVP